MGFPRSTLTASTFSGNPIHHHRSKSLNARTPEWATVLTVRKTFGYVATIVSGEIIAENGRPTVARPGKLVRGRQPEPSHS